MFLKFSKQRANSFLNVSLNRILYRGYLTHEHKRPTNSAKSKSINFPTLLWDTLYLVCTMFLFFFSVSDSISNSLRVVKTTESKKEFKIFSEWILIVWKIHFGMKYPVCSFSSFQSQTPFPIHCAWSKPLGKLFLRPSAMLTQSSMSWPKMDSWAFLDGALKLGELAFLICVKGCP